MFTYANNLKIPLPHPLAIVLLKIKKWLIVWVPFVWILQRICHVTVSQQQRYNTVSVCYRTKWKRQTAVGLELLAEAGNYAAFQRLYGAPAYGCWYPPQTAGPPAAPSAADIYYRQAAAAAAATLQKPLPYRLYPPGMGLGMPGPSAHLGSLAASSSLSTLSSYYSSQTPPDGPSPRSPSPDTPLDPGSPGTGGRRSPSEDEDTIHVWRRRRSGFNIVI